MGAEANILDHRHRQGKIALRAVAQTPSVHLHVGVPSRRRIRRRMNAGSLGRSRGRTIRRTHPSKLPLLAEPLLRTIYSQFERRVRQRGQVHDLMELEPCPTDPHKILELPRHHRGEISAGGLAGATVHAHRLPGGAPSVVRDRTGRRADVVSKGEQRIKLRKELGMIGNRVSLCRAAWEGGIAVDEGRAGNRNVFVAPEPATAGEVKEKVGTRADTLPGFAALAR